MQTPDVISQEKLVADSTFSPGGCGSLTVNNKMCKALISTEEVFLDQS